MIKYGLELIDFLNNLITQRIDNKKLNILVKPFSLLSNHLQSSGNRNFIFSYLTTVDNNEIVEILIAVFEMIELF